MKYGYVYVAVCVVIVAIGIFTMFQLHQKPTPLTSKEATTLPDTSHISLTIDDNLKKIPVGAQFLVYITVRNDGQGPVQFYSSGNAMRIEFDKNVIDSRWGGCVGISSQIYPELQSLMPQQTITFHFPTTPCGAYLANSGGLTNLTAGFRYLSQDIQHTVNVSKIFQIS